MIIKGPFCKRESKRRYSLSVRSVIESLRAVIDDLPAVMRQVLLRAFSALPGWYLAALLVALVIIIILVIDNHRFVVRRYRLRTSKVRKDFTFVYLTDQHAKIYGEDNEKVLRRIREINPDAVLVGGDMIISAKAKKNDRGWKEDMLGLLRQIAKSYPVYYAAGNHEERLKTLQKTAGYQGIYDQYFRDLIRCGVRPLHNEGVFLDNLQIYGLELPIGYYSKGIRKNLHCEYIDELLGIPYEKQYTVLLAHNPRFFKTYAAWGADLVLSGHLHGGIARLPYIGGVIGPDFRLFPRYTGGRYAVVKEEAARGREGKRVPADGYSDEEVSTMVLSCGMGMHTIPVRFLNPAEMTVVTIESTRPFTEEDRKKRRERIEKSRAGFRKKELPRTEEEQDMKQSTALQDLAEKVSGEQHEPAASRLSATVNERETVRDSAKNSTDGNQIEESGNAQGSSTSEGVSVRKTVTQNRTAAESKVQIQRNLQRQRDMKKRSTELKKLREQKRSKAEKNGNQR